MSLLEILDLAIKKEIDGFHDYTDAASRTEDSEAKALLMQLARDEQEHQQLLEAQCRLLLSPVGDDEERAETDMAARHDYLAARKLAASLVSANEELKGRQVLYEYDLQVAAGIQRTLLPTALPKLPGLDIGAHISMARKVGGDYYDFATNDAGRLWTAIGDVSGKGIPASLLMATARAAWRSIVATEPEPARMLDILNRAVYPDFAASDSFVTFFTALYNPEDSELHYAGAGHNPPFYLANGDEECRELPSSGPMVGVLLGARFEQSRIRLAPGDIVVMYTDGLTEARRDREFFGEHRLSRLIQTHRRLDAQSLTDAIMDEVRQFQSARAQADDITLVVLKKL